jgi:hypothetical protein
MSSVSYEGIKNQILPCIVCDAGFESPVGSKNESNMPYQGTVFSSHGNYGSTVWDPMWKKTTIEVNICDDCLKKAAREDKVYVCTVKEDTTYTTALWDPSKDYQHEGW